MEPFSHAAVPLIRAFPLIILFVTEGSSQPLSFGLKAGVPLTPSLKTVASASASATTNPYIGGAFVELRLPRNLSLEFDVLYRHLHYSDSLILPLLGGEFERVSASAWEFPLLLKYRFRGDAIRPYVFSGPGFDVIAQKNRYTEFSEFGPPPGQATGGTSSSSLALQNSVVAGLTAGVGVELPAGRFRISPEIRYTRWFWANFSAPYALNGKQNQVEFVIGLSF